MANKLLILPNREDTFFLWLRPSEARPRWDYFEAIAMAGMRLAEFRQVPVDESIREYLTAESFEKVKGRYQIAVFQLTKPIVEQGAPATADKPRR